ncbi:MAG: XRE family transcriptional regulator [Paludibacter sp.]|nr:XRE family transcriptional regulator [Paludibacter sp.]
MNTQIKQIAERIRGLREVLNISVVDAANKCNISEAEFIKYESGISDIPVSFICQFAQCFGVECTTLMSGDEPRMSTYFVTRKGTGISVERTKAYKYQALAHGFRQAKIAPFEVTVEPNDLPVTLNTHPGQELNLVLEGTLLLHIAGNDVILNEGDSIYFDATKPHGMKAGGGKKVKFLAVVG